MNQKLENMGHNHHEELLNQEWLNTSSNLFLEKLGQNADLQFFLESTPELKSAFEKPGDTLECSDGRVNCGGIKMGLAGEGIFLKGQDRQDFVAQNKGRIKKVTSHVNCGALDLEAKTNGLPDGIENADDLGKKKAEELATELGAEYEHVTKLLSEVHNERVLVLDCTGYFNPKAWEKMPPHFISSAPALGLGEDYAKTEVKILTGIALSDHGFGKRFSADTPFFIVIAANNPKELDLYRQAMQISLAEFEDRVQIEGFIAPPLIKKD